VKKPDRLKKVERPSNLDDAALQDARVLIVEDDFLILIELETVLGEAGARIVGACRTVDEALAVAGNQDIDAALLDLRVGPDTIAPVAYCLDRRGVPFAFYTGQTETDPIRVEWPDCEIVAKPAAPKAIVAAVAALLRGQRRG
jgi:DNA-binding response OmpR family regulator